MRHDPETVLRDTAFLDIGTLCVIDGERRCWADENIVALADLAAVVFTEIELRTAVAEAARRDAHRALLLDAGSLLSSSLDERETLERSRTSSCPGWPTGAQRRPS